VPFSTTTHLTSPSVLFLCLFEKQLTTNGRHFGSQQYTAHVSNSEVCSKTGQPTITTLIKQSGQCGHVARADQLKITTVHCEHLSTHLVTGDGREDSLVRPGYELSVMISNVSILVNTELSMGWVDPWVGSRFFSFWWVGLGPLQQKY